MTTRHLTGTCSENVSSGTDADLEGPAYPTPGCLAQPAAQGYSLSTPFCAEQCSNCNTT